MDTREIESYVLSSIQASPKLQKMLVPALGVELPRLHFPELRSFAVMGLNEEAGEVAGLACRECYKGIPMSQYKWQEELGDVLWYLVAATIAKGLTLEDLWNYNVEKLEGRYGTNRSLE